MEIHQENTVFVNSYNQEFGYELLSSVPYAYGRYLQGKLKGTISAPGSEPLYYFSPTHKINKELRSWTNTLNARRENELPYTNIHTSERPNLTFPPYKEVYKNKKYVWKKPTLCICNRYNKEWNQPPINFFDPQILEWLFENLKNDYEIIYFAVDLPADLQDENHHIDLPDRAIAERHGVKVFQDIKRECWNESMLKVFANCEYYITMNGGYSILASLFGGTNIIYTTQRGNFGCHELKHKSFWRWYPNHADQRTVPVESYEELKQQVKVHYINKLPTLNIILRTSGRPKAFRVCLKSIQVQTYPNINVVVVTDSIDGVHYTRGHNVRHIHLPDVKYNPEPHEGGEYGRSFKSNLYVNHVLQHIHEGYVMVLDDDDMFTSKDSARVIMENVDENKLLVWKIDFIDRVIPGKSFGKKVTLYDIDSNCFAHHVKHKELTDWSEWKRADFRTANKLSENMPVKWLDTVLTIIQKKPGNGARHDIVITNKGHMKTVRVISPKIGQVGKLKRLPKKVAAEVVQLGQAEYITDVIDKLNKPPEVRGKPIVTENKAIDPVTENKEIKPATENKEVKDDPKPTIKRNKRVRTTRTNKSKKLPKANK